MLEQKKNPSLAALKKEAAALDKQVCLIFYFVENKHYLIGPILFLMLACSIQTRI